MPIGVYEWDRFKKAFPDLAMSYKSFKIDPYRPHAIIVTLNDNRELYFDCGKKPSDFTLTTDQEVINHIRFSRKLKR